MSKPGIAADPPNPNIARKWHTPCLVIGCPEIGEEVDAVRVRGSPDIKQRITATISRGRKTIKVDVVPTGKTSKVEAPPADDFSAEEIAAGKADLEPGEAG